MAAYNLDARKSQHARDIAFAKHQALLAEEKPHHWFAVTCGVIMFVIATGFITMLGWMDIRDAADYFMSPFMGLVAGYIVGCLTSAFVNLFCPKVL